MISESPLVLIVKRGSGKLRRAAREVHLHQFDVKRPTRGCGAPKAWVHHTSTCRRLYDRVDSGTHVRFPLRIWPDLPEPDFGKISRIADWKALAQFSVRLRI